MSPARKSWAIAISVMFIAGGEIAAASGPDFAKDIRPLFEQRCVKCHGPEKQKGGLRFDSKEGAFKTAESGEPVIVPGHASQSRIIKLVSSNDLDERMPPKGDPLSMTEIDLLKRWIDAGAEWGENVKPVSNRSEMVVTDEDRKHWSYRTLSDPTVPVVKNSRDLFNPVDRFIVAKLEEKNLSLSRTASSSKLVRRIYFDLTGLPPTPPQVEAFELAYTLDSHAAVTSLVTELLASPHYGERWARHWLDVVRYADSDGQEADADRPTAHYYRDFVIRALNDDMAFDQFARWQLAGDELEPDEPLAIAATGFITAGTHAVIGPELMEEERIRSKFNELDDMIATTGTAMLGLTLACARCHDHKYDPVPRRDYYRLMNAFNCGDRAEVPLVPLEAALRYRDAQATWKSDFDHAKKELDQWLDETRKANQKLVREAKIDALNATAEEKNALKNDPSTAPAEELRKKFAKELKIADKDLRAVLSEEARMEWDTRAKRLKSVEARKPQGPQTALAFADYGPKPQETWLLGRGDFKVKTEPVELGFLTVLTRNKTPKDYWTSARAQRHRSDSTQQRRALAEWMTDLDQGAGALMARVIVNRVWQHHFGEGLVRTVNDFGARADPPAQPELLEWLTVQFVKSGWRLKPLHQLIMTSAVYLQDDVFDERKAKVDPDNRLWWRRRPQRIESEILRDSILAVSGTLNTEMLGPAFKAPIAAEAIQARNTTDPYPKDLKDTPATHRRSVYMFHKRVVQYPLMQAFDGPDAQASCGQRIPTTVAPQALALLNDHFIRARAEDLARRLQKEAGTETSAKVRLAWKLAFAREPSRNEMETGAEFFGYQAAARASVNADSQFLALTDLCQAIFAMNEFIYVD